MASESTPTKEQDFDVTESSDEIIAGPTSVKRGHKCCGGCCDVRRAVIIVDALRILLTVWTILGVLILKRSEATYMSTLTDDEKIASMNASFDDISIPGVIIASSLRIVAQIAGLVGAVQYNHILVLVAAVALGVDILVGVVGLNVVMVVEAAIYLYPHVMLIREMRNGIMTKANYVNEKYSCCCV